MNIIADTLSPLINSRPSGESPQSSSIQSPHEGQDVFSVVMDAIGSTPSVTPSSVTEVSESGMDLSQAVGEVLGKTLAYMRQDDVNGQSSPLFRQFQLNEVLQGLPEEVSREIVSQGLLTEEALALFEQGKVLPETLFDLPLDVLAKSGPHLFEGHNIQYGGSVQSVSIETVVNQTSVMQNMPVENVTSVFNVTEMPAVAGSVLTQPEELKGISHIMAVSKVDVNIPVQDNMARSGSLGIIEASNKASGDVEGAAFGQEVSTSETAGQRWAAIEGTFDIQKEELETPKLALRQQVNVKGQEFKFRSPKMMSATTSQQGEQVDFVPTFHSDSRISPVVSGERLYAVDDTALDNRKHFKTGAFEIRSLTLSIPDQELIGRKIYQSLPQPLEANKRYEISLKPQHHGHVRVSIEFLESGRVAVLVQADKISTLNSLKEDAALLQQALEGSGYDLSDQTLNFSLQEERSSAFENHFSPMKHEPAGEVNMGSILEKGEEIDIGPAHLSIRT